MKKLTYDYIGPIDDYYAIIGADLRITCNMESNEIISDKMVMKGRTFYKGVFYR